MRKNNIVEYIRKQELIKYVTDVFLQYVSESSEQDELVKQVSSNQANSLTTISHKEFQEARSLVESMKNQKIPPGTRTW